VELQRQQAAKQEPVLGWSRAESAVQKKARAWKT
jgi:hypothetical protein